MALDFPQNPALNDYHVFGYLAWKWDGTKWASSTPDGGIYLPLFGGTQFPMTGFLYQKTLGDPGASTVWAGFGAQRWRFKTIAGDDFNSGSIDYRLSNANALTIAGAGNAAGSRQITLSDHVTVGANLAVVGNTVLSGGLSVVGSITATGTVSQVAWQDRTNLSSTWLWYASGGIARLYNAADRIWIDSGGSLFTQGNITANGNNLYLAGGSGSTGPRLYADTTNMLSQLGSGAGSFLWWAYGGTQVMQMTNAGVLTLAQSGFRFTPTDAQSTTLANFTPRRWRFQVNTGDEVNAGAIDYRGYDGAALTIIGASASAGSRLVRIYDNLVVSGFAQVVGNFRIGNYLNFNGSASGANPPYIYADATNMDFRYQGASAGNFSWYTGGGTRLMYLDAGPTLSVAGVVLTTGAGNMIQFAGRDGGRTWGWYAVANIARLWNNIDSDRLWLNSGTMYLQGSNGGDSLVIYRTGQGAFMTFKPETTTNTAQIGYYGPGFGWGTINFPTYTTFDGAISVDYLRVRSQVIGLSGYTGGLGGSGGPCLYGDGNWIVLKPGSGNLGMMLYDYNGAVRVYLRTDGTIWATGTGGGGQFRMWNSTGAASMWYNDGTNTYLLLTNNGDANGSYNGLRPVYYNNFSGYVNMGHGLSVDNGGIYSRASAVDKGLIIVCTNGETMRMFNDGNSHIESNTTLWLQGNTSQPTTVGGSLLVRATLTTNDVLWFNNWATYPNNTYFYCRDTVGTHCSVFILANDNQLYFGYGNRVTIWRGSNNYFQGRTHFDTEVHTTGGGAGWYFEQRTGGYAWMLYGADGLARLWHSAIGDRIYFHQDMHIYPVGGNSATCGNNAWWNVISVNFSNPSDPRLKQDIEPAPQALAAVRALKPVTYRWRQGKDTKRRHHGLLSTDVREVLGDDFGGLVYNEPTNDHGGYDTLAINQLLAVLWKAVQEMADETESLREEIETLKSGLH